MARTAAAAGLEQVAGDVIACERCPRLRRWCLEVARRKRRAFAGETYWGRPVPGFGDAAARLLIVGLAPAAHGANRTGRMFTGDSSGDWLYRALHRSGFASQATAVHRDDGLELRQAYIGALCRCAPPDNRPTPGEQERCSEYLGRELELLRPHLGAIVCLGALAWQATIGQVVAAGAPRPRPRPRFGHGREWRPGAGLPLVLASYHPSRQNTNTGRLTEAMLDSVFRRARQVVEGRR